MSNSQIVIQWKSAGPYLQSVLRIITGLLLAVQGSILIFAFPGPMMPGAGPVPVASQMGIGGILQFVGGILLMIGLFTRLSAFILSGMMAVAFFQFHFKTDWPSGILPNLNQGTPSVVLCFVYLFFSSVGGGKWSIDGLRGGDDS